MVIPFLHSPFSTGHKGVSHLAPWRSYAIGSSFSSFSILREPRRCDYLLTDRSGGQKRHRWCRKCSGGVATASQKSSRWQRGSEPMKGEEDLLLFPAIPSYNPLAFCSTAMAMTTLPLRAHEICPCSCSYSSQISSSLGSSSAVRTAGIFRLRTPKVWSVGVGHGARAMAPDEEKMTRRSPLDFPVEWDRPRPGRRPDIFPQFSPMKTPLPPPLPADPPEEDEEEEEKKEEEEENPDAEPEKKPDIGFSL